MNTRSIRFKLIVWYAGLLLAVIVVFGAYAYQRLDHYLSYVLTKTLSMRAQRIGATLVANIPQTGEEYVSKEIEIRYAPELNDRFIRVTRPDGSTLYISGAPNDRSFDPKDVGAPRATAATREEKTGNGTDLLIVTEPTFVGTQKYFIEVGASQSANDSVLHGFLLTLTVGLPAVLALATCGGYVLIKQALAPVQKIMGAAQEITLHHLDKRLPVVRTGDEIERLSNALNQMISRLDRSFQISNRFTADASHELRTPLTIMRGELETMLSNEQLPGEIRDTLDSLFEETERLSKIVAELLALSRLDTGEAQMERVKLDLAELASTTVEQMCLLAEEKEIALACETTGPVEVEGDRARLKQVVVNLLDNAIKYTPSKGTIRLFVRARNGRAELGISDTGPGVPDAALAHVFDRFFRADEVRSREVDGAGLGLSIVQSICSAHGGSITVENLQAGGCCFTASIPLAGRN